MFGKRHAITALLVLTAGLAPSALGADGSCGVDRDRGRRSGGLWGGGWGHGKGWGNARVVVRWPDWDQRRPSHRDREEVSQSVTLCEEFCLDGKKVKAHVKLWTECGELHTQVTFEPVGCSLPEIERVSVRLNRDGRSYRPTLCRADERCDGDRVTYRSEDGLRWSGCGEFSVTLKVESCRDDARVCWDDVRLN